MPEPTPSVTGLPVPSENGSRCRAAIVRCAAAALLCVTLAAPAQAAPDENEASAARDVQPARLEEIQRSIGREQRRLDQAGQKREALQTALARSEQQANVVSARVRQIAASLRSKQQELKAMSARRDAQAAELQQERQRLAQRVRAAYRAGRGESLKLLLNLESPGKAARAIAYHDYATRGLRQRIASGARRIAQLASLELEIADETRTLELLHARANAARDQLLAERKRRQTIIAALDQDIAGAAGRIAELRAAERSLRRLVSRIQEREVDPEQVAPDELQPFAAARGQMMWPTRGQLRNSFSTRPSDEDLHWQGVFIAAPDGQAVHAVAAGRVAFADWIRGFGLVVIVEHQGGYMSLYGHARELRVEAGAWVQANEVLATVGDTGGQNRTGLYFEIRKQGKPQSPRRWCAGSPRTRPLA